MRNEQLSMFGSKSTGIEFIVETEPTTTNPVVRKGRKRVASSSTYANFYREGSQLSTSIHHQSEEKLRLLTTYFPGQFGVWGREPLKERESQYIASKFNHLLRSAKKYAEIQ